MGMVYNKYQVTPEGLIFTIQDDGTIRQLAKILPDGNIEPISAGVLQKEEGARGKKGSGGVAAFFIVLLVVGLLIAIFTAVQYKSESSYLRNRVYSLEDGNNQLFEVWADTYPIVITDLQVRNRDEEYGAAIYSRNTTFINPKIAYKSLVSKHIKLDIKLWTPSGLQSKGTASEGAYTYSQDVYVYQGGGVIELNGWGNVNKGHWEAGRYGYEIWCNGKMLKDKVFYIKK